MSASPASTSLLFSLKEAAVLSQLPEERLRREVDRKAIAPKTVTIGSAHRLWFHEFEVLYLAMLNSLSDAIEIKPERRVTIWRLLSDRDPTGRFGRDRRKAWDAVYRDAHFRHTWVSCVKIKWAKSVSPFVTISWDMLINDVGTRLDLYRQGLGRIHEDQEILGGEPVFKGTRLAVRHVGGMRTKGEPADRIIADYPELSAADIEFARLYTAAHPIVGRPSTGVVTA